MGETPLPKYITRPLEDADAERYQSIFAKVEGAVAAPVASLHFSKNLMKKLEIKGIDTVEMTMHVGLGTFRQVEVEDLSKHKMESEQYWIYPNTAERVNQAKAERRKVCAVGTSVIRSLESASITDHRTKSGNGWTSKFIFPPHEFKVVNSLITNFHAPQSTMLMLTAAFAGYELTMDIYNTAVKENYRFLSDGDALMFV